MAPYTLVHPQLAVLLRRFHAPRSKLRTEQPFWRMQHDGIWEVDRPECVRCNGNGDPSVGDLKGYKIQGGFTAPVVTALSGDSAFAFRAADAIMATYLGGRSREAILEATGIPLSDRHTQG